MKPYGLNELRKMFLKFFEEKDHVIVKSYSLVPQNDKSLLLIGAGMAPLKPYFTGQENPPAKRMATCQKCIRTPDIDNVGKNARHGTFFEMLGNFSFGDYYKKEAIQWSWEFLTKVLEIPEDRLYPSVYTEDDEAYEIWNKDIGIEKERIFRMGKEDNFWEHGSGPCGPCSEIYFDRGEKYSCGKPDCMVGCDCDRYIEIWNNVFTQFESDGKGNYTELDTKNIDTGMGLERLGAAVQGVDSIFETDTILSVLNQVCKLSGKRYKEKETDDISIRIITDHIRSAVFMLSDGVIPSNEGRGYVLRRLIRRASRYGRLLGIRGLFLAGICDIVIQTSQDGYPELTDKKKTIQKFLTVEEENFNTTIDQGLSILNENMTELDRSGTKVLSGENAFKLYDTYGFPLDLTKEILEEKGFSLDEKRFGELMEVQRTTARAARKETNYMGADSTVYQLIDADISSEFVGYDHTETKDSKVTILTTNEEITDMLKEGEEGTILVDKTPFYAAKGGQCGDTGTITVIRPESTKALANSDPCGEFTVKDTIAIQGNKIGHVGIVTKGSLSSGNRPAENTGETVNCPGDTVRCQIDEKRRALICANHSATHLLQKALRMVLGSHVEQAGSDVSEDRLRFDFTHFSALTLEEIYKIEDIVNEQISLALPVATKEMTQEEARKTGAMALFGEKYGEVVRVVQMGDFSSELCGGTHVKNTGEIRSFKIISEAGIAAGVRRMEAKTGGAIMAYYRSLGETLENVTSMVKSDKVLVVDKIGQIIEDLKAANKEIDVLKAKLANEAAGDIASHAKKIGDISVLIQKIDHIGMNELRNLGDTAKNKLGESVILFGSTAGGKVNLIAMATDGAIKNGAHAGNIIKKIAGIVGGGGGGRPGMAQAGGKLPDKLDEALSRAGEVIRTQIS